MLADPYIAGYIDGEGCIRVQHMRGQGGGSSQYIPQVTVTSVTPEVLTQLKLRFAGWLREYQPPSKNGNARRATTWTIQGRDSVLGLMRAIQPYCIIKKAQVELMVQFITEGEPSAPPKPISPAEIERRQQIFIQFGVLNKRGVANVE